MIYLSTDYNKMAQINDPTVKTNKAKQTATNKKTG